MLLTKDSKEKVPNDERPDVSAGSLGGVQLKHAVLLHSATGMEIESMGYAGDAVGIHTHNTGR